MKRFFGLITTLLFVSASNNLKAQTSEEFIKKAAQGNMAEINAGRLATEAAGNDSVKYFGNMMIEDHTKALDELLAIAKEKNITTSEFVDSAHKKAADKLMTLIGKKFDYEYMQQQVKDHKETIALFENEASSGTDERLKAYAHKYLPAIKMHLQMAQRISGQNKQ
jgi:putative membrane protein